MPGKVGSLALAFLLLLALFTPCAPAEKNGSEVDTFESLTALVIEGEQVMTGADAVHLRYGIDALGDNNSHVSSPEVTAFELAYETFVKQHANEYTLNGVEGVFTDLVATFKDAEGPVDSTAAVTYQYQGRIGFTGINPDLGLYTFRVVNEGGDLNTTMNIRITVPTGFEITSNHGIYAARISNEGRTVEGQTLTDANVEIEFSHVNEYSWMFWPLLISGLLSAVIVAVLAVSHFRGGGEEFRERPPTGEVPKTSEDVVGASEDQGESAGG
jgi:hypothetical protein